MPTVEAGGGVAPMKATVAESVVLAVPAVIVGDATVTLVAPAAAKFAVYVVGVDCATTASVVDVELSCQFWKISGVVPFIWLAVVVRVQGDPGVHTSVTGVTYVPGAQPA